MNNSIAKSVPESDTHEIRQRVLTPQEKYECEKQHRQLAAFLRSLAVQPFDGYFRLNIGEVALLRSILSPLKAEYPRAALLDRSLAESTTPYLSALDVRFLLLALQTQAESDPVHAFRQQYNRSYDTDIALDVHYATLSVAPIPPISLDERRERKARKHVHLVPAIPQPGIRSRPVYDDADIR